MTDRERERREIGDLGLKGKNNYNEEKRILAPNFYFIFIFIFLKAGAQNIEGPPLFYFSPMKIILMKSKSYILGRSDKINLFANSNLPT